MKSTTHREENSLWLFESQYRRHVGRMIQPSPRLETTQIWGFNIIVLKLGMGFYQLVGLCSFPKRSEVQGISRFPTPKLTLTLTLYRVGPVTTTTMYRGLWGPLSALSCEDSMVIPVCFKHESVLALPLSNSFSIKGSQTMCRAHSPFLPSVGRTKDQAHVRCSINVCYVC